MLPAERQSMSFLVGGAKVSGILHLPARADDVRLPCVVLAHGWGMVMEGDLQNYAASIADKQFAAFTFDFRNLGLSDGLPRQLIDPVRQIEDYRAAITFVRGLPAIDPERIGLWGSSFAGGHVLAVTAMDARVRCAVAQVPTISSWKTARRKLSPDQLRENQAMLIADREASDRGAEPGIIKTVGSVAGERVTYSDPHSLAYMMRQGEICPSWRNYSTLSSIERARCYEPGAYVDRIVDTPLLMIVAEDDTVTPVDFQREAFARIPSPTKRLLAVPGGHYAVYEDQFGVTSAAAAGWFAEHL